MKYIKDRKEIIILFIVIIMAFFLIFYLYSLPYDALLYGYLLISICFICILLIDLYHYNKKLKQIEYLKREDKIEFEGSLLEMNLVQAFEQREKNLIGQNDSLEEQIQNIEDYFSIWVHQMKLPIAAMKLLLESDTIDVKACKSQLFRMNQNTDMTLAYIRMNSKQTDYLFQFYDLDNMIRKSIHYFAYEFVSMNLSMNFEQTNKKILTDEKWFVFILQQILSNAIKYSKKGGNIHIYFKASSLVIEDHGCGIEQGDLHRIFEKGFTGYNGRMDHKASGLGLYLCKGICKSLNHEISIESKLNEGTKVYITFLLETCKENR